LIRSLGKIVLISSQLLLYQCGNDADFSGQANERQDSPPEPLDAVAEPPDDDEPIALNPIIDSFALDIKGDLEAVDVVFLVDTSGSMGEEKRRLEQNFKTFISAFINSPTAIDYQIFLVGADFTFPTDVVLDPKVDVINQRIGSHDALFVGYELLTNGLPGQTLNLRTGVTKELVVITDDEANRAVPQMMDLIKNPVEYTVRLNGFIGFKAGYNNSFCKIENVGKNYMLLSTQSVSPGLIQDLCTDDWSKLLDNLGAAIANRKPARYPLSNTIDVNKAIVVLVDGSALDPQDYAIDNETQHIEVETSRLDPNSTTLTIEYFPSTEGVLEFLRD
jgi:hypothetical protein